MGRRRQSREIALQALYIMDTSGTPREEAFKIVNRRKDPGDAETLAFASALLEGACSFRDELDLRLETIAENWTMPRMAAVDRNILRLAAYELIYRQDTPINVVIDEAIEIARRFSTEEATKFINGILDKAKSLRPSNDGP